MSAPPPRLTADQKAAAARLRAAGVPDGLALDVAAGRVAEPDAAAWLAEYRGQLEAGRARGGWVKPTPGGAVLGTKAPPAGEEVVWIGTAGAKRRRVMRTGPPPTPDAPGKEVLELWTQPGLAGWWRAPA